MGRARKDGLVGPARLLYSQVSGQPSLLRGEEGQGMESVPARAGQHTRGRGEAGIGSETVLRGMRGFRVPVLWTRGRRRSS